MRHVKKTASPPQHLLDAVPDLTTLVEAVDLDSISDDVYKGAHRYVDPQDGREKSGSHTRDALNVFYHSKCAYCELLCKAEIEHYRPKKGVKEQPGYGYYWLCYEWTNLLPSCRYCNTEGGKGTQFPVMGKRPPGPPLNAAKKFDASLNATDARLTAEKPYLLNPEIDEPRDFLAFELNAWGEGIDITGTDDLERGSKSIAICNLNREYLRFDRDRNLVYNIVQEINAKFESEDAGVYTPQGLLLELFLYFDRLKKAAANEKLTHSLLRWFIVETYENFAAIIGPLLPDEKQRLVVLGAFKRYKILP
jgi:hypothetical protein